MARIAPAITFPSAARRVPRLRISPDAAPVAPFPLHPGLAGHRVAVIDIGSNSIRLLAVELAANLSWQSIAEERAMTRLAQGIAGSGELCPEAMARSVEAIGRFLAIARQLNCTTVRAYATAAVREAANRDDFLSLVYDRTGLRLSIVSALDEGKLTHQSVAHAIDISHGTAAVVDIGGGSLEVVLSQDGIIVDNTSMPLGAVRLTEEFGGAQACAGERFKEMRRHAERLIRGAVHSPGKPPDTLVGCGGTFTTILTLAAAARGLTIDRNSPALLTLGPVSRRQLKSLIRRLRALSLEERLRVVGLPSDRADIILAGMVVVERLMRRLGATQLRVHPGGFRQGLLLRLIDELAIIDAHAHLSDTQRLDGVRAFAQRCQHPRNHSEHVAHLALSLYDQLRAQAGSPKGLGAGRDERVLLEAAAVLHDVGVCVEYRRHHKHSRTIIRHADLPGFTPREIEIIALVARYHRRALPSKKHHAFAALPAADRALVQRLAAILRVADGLDRQHAQNCRSLRARLDHSTLLIAVDVSHDPTSDFKAARSKGALLEKLLRVRLVLEAHAPARRKEHPGQPPRQRTPVQV